MPKTIYISIDIEADGPIPGVYSMLSLGAAAFQLANNPQGWQQLGKFKRNILPLPGALQDPDTMTWWKTQPKAWEASTTEAVEASLAMQDFVTWLQMLRQNNDNAPLVLIGFPVTYDFMFVYWYMVKFTGHPTPCGFQGLDIKTLAMDRLQCDFKQATKRNMPKRWFKDVPPHTHDALDDAIGQGILLMNILKES